LCNVRAKARTYLRDKDSDGDSGCAHDGEQNGQKQIPPLRCGMTNKRIDKDNDGDSGCAHDGEQNGQKQIPPLRCGMTNKRIDKDNDGDSGL
jgi:predicted lipoprotein with Yx(FWY)xxD motif